MFLARGPRSAPIDLNSEAICAWPDFSLRAIKGSSGSLGGNGLFFGRG
jgi:hypothetical protein